MPHIIMEICGKNLFAQIWIPWNKFREAVKLPKISMQDDFEDDLSERFLIV